MNIKQEKICRLCFNSTNNEFEIMDEITRQVLDVLPVKINLDASETPTVCCNCSEAVKKFYNIKGICSRFGEALTKNESEFESEEGSGDSSICRFCMNPQASNNFVHMDVLISEPTFEKIWPTIMTEMEPDVIKNFLTCVHCKDNLEHYLKFVRCCWDTEEKINMYCQRNGSNSKGNVNLSDVQHFLLEDIFVYPNNRVMKQEVNVSEIVNFKPHNDSLKHDELHIKEEAADNSCQNQQNIGKEICDESYNKNDKSYVTSKMYQCEICTFKTKYRQCLKYHALKHKDNSEVKMHECTMCTFKTKYKIGLKQHSLIHKSASELKMYKCAHCPYETKWKRNIRQHVPIHRDPSKAENYECTICSYKTIYKSSLKTHMLSHKNSSKVKLFKCTMCPYETKQKHNITTHVLTHKDTSKVEMYECPMCIFETKYKHYLKMHLQIHQDILGEKMHSCTQCSYVARHKFLLTRHMSVHQQYFEEDVFTCLLCTFETIYRSNLKSHMLTHINAGGIVQENKNVIVQVLK